MDSTFLIITGLMSFLLLAVIIRMVSNRVKGREELDGLFVFRHRKKD